MPENDNWDMNQERVYHETVLATRLNYFFVFFSLVLAGGFSAEGQLQVRIIFSLGFVISWLLTATIVRLQQKIDYILREMFREDPDMRHPASRVHHDVGGVSMRWVTGYAIPLLCSLVLTVLAILSYVGVLEA
ncbi:MAG: hypothetical protein JSV79_01940 [Armatimonadota bacterium]|nr:MAG: hypothetical protein JSV79_01940 [Armatimonadota bacterium]